jgi:two-component sensor histidine kinase
MSLARYASRPEVAEAPAMLLVEEITHRVLNEYTEAICALDRAAAAADARSAGAITAAMARLQACAEAHRALQAPISAGPRNLADHLTRLCIRLAGAELEVRGVRLVVAADEVCLSAEQCWHVGLIVAELVRNAARHGLRGRAGEIRLDVHERFGRVRCTVRDTGQPGEVEGVGRGRRVVRAMAQRLGGSIEWAFTPTGCCARLEFPVEPLERASPYVHRRRAALSRSNAS